VQLVEGEKLGEDLWVPRSRDPEARRQGKTAGSEVRTDEVKGDWGIERHRVHGDRSGEVKHVVALKWDVSLELRVVQDS
jgi:hypothetical protein